LRRRRSSRGLSHPCRRRLRPASAMRPRNLPRGQSRRRAGEDRADAQSLSRPSRRAGRKLRRFHPPVRHRRTESFVRDAGQRMTHTTPPPLPTLIPDTAPFSPEQRTWLNGFLTGLLSLDGGVNPLSPAESAALVPAVGVAQSARRDRFPLSHPVEQKRLEQRDLAH